MIYGLSLLLVLLALVMGVPAMRALLRMARINKNCQRTTGEVVSNPSVLGWLWTSSFGSSTRPLIRYFSPKGSELKLEVSTSSMLTIRRYEKGMSMEVIYSADNAGQAYAGPEWGSALQDLKIATGALLLAVALWVTGVLIHAPF